MIEDIKDIEQQAQLNKLYDTCIKEYLDEIPGNNSVIANDILRVVRNRYKMSNDEIIELFKSDFGLARDYSNWFLEGYPYKLFIAIDYYAWREYFKINRILNN